MNTKYYINAPLGILLLFHLALLFPSTPAHAYLNELAVKNDQGITFPAQAQPGNIFVQGEKVQIDASIAKGASADWAVTDYQDQKVASGTAAVKDGKVTIEPAATGLGFYLVKFRAGKGEGTTSYAVIPPLDNSKMADARFGVASHFGKNMTTDLAPLLAKAGIAHVRDSIDWHWIEPTPGKFDFTVHDFTGRMADLQKNHIVPLITTCFGNAIHYDDPKIPEWAAAPHTPEQYRAFTQNNVAHLKQFGTQIQALEIWNEYNGSFCKGVAATDRPKYYAEMLQDAYRGIKAERPDVQVLGGALNEMPLPYCEKLFSHGALDYMDGIVIHPYGGTPKSVEKNIRDFVDLMKKYNKGVAKPIWVTEFGDWDDHTVKRAEAAAMLTKMYAMLLDQPEVARAYWYLARDYEEFPTEGLVHSDSDPMGKYTPSANYAAYATMANQLFNATPKGHEVTDPRTDIYHFERNGQGIWVCWSETETTSLVFQTTAPLREIDMVGGEQKLAPDNGQVTVKLDGQPVYLIADQASTVASVRERARSDQVMADAATGFAGEQGQNGWSYFSYTSNKNGTAPYDPAQVEPMNYTVTPGDWGHQWTGSGQLEIDSDKVKPAVENGNQQWAVRRWTSTTGGDLRLMGEVTRGDKGDGVGLKIFVDGRPVYSKMIPPKGEEKIDQTITVKPGSLVDFAITPGPGTDASFDATRFQAMVLAPAK